MAGETKVLGVPNLRAQLEAVPERLRRRVLRNALAAGARVVRDAARRAAPVLKKFDKRRKPGTLKKAITVRTSKRDQRAGNVGVFVNVRPARGPKRFRQSTEDPFYWRWIEFGHRILPKSGKTKYTTVVRTRKDGTSWSRTYKSDAASIRNRRRNATIRVPAIPFLRPAISTLGAALDAFKAAIGPAIAKLNKPK
jgi:HK97 gp10 family phage protein